MEFSKILLPLDLEWPSMPAVHHTALLARHFHSHVVILSVVREATFLGIDVDHVDAMMRSAREHEKELQDAIGPALKGIPTRQLLLRGDPGRTILETAQSEKADLIVIGPHARPTFIGKLMGSVTHSILNAAESPIWSSSDSENGSPALQVRRMVCGVDFTAHDRKVIQWAAAVAAEFKSKIILVHATPDIEIYGPGGFYSPAELAKSLADAATRHIHTLIQDTGVHGEIFVSSGEVHSVLNQAASESGADLLVIGRRPSMGMLGRHAYKIVSHARVPVLSV